MSGKAYSVSVSHDDHAEEHSRRSYTPASAERSLHNQNIVIYDCGNDRSAFNDFFEDAILAYNAKQKRSDRKKSLDYLSALENGQEGYGKGKQKEKPFYHSVIQIGSRDTLGVTDPEFDVQHWKELKREHKWHEAEQYVKKHLNKSEDREKMTDALREIGESLQVKYPFCKFWGINIHRDEPNGTDHMDVRYTIFTDDEKIGLTKRVSMNKGLAKMGFKTDKEKTALQHFQDAIKRDIEDAMIRRGYSRQYMSNTERHVSTSIFQTQQEKKKEIEIYRYLSKANARLSAQNEELTKQRDIYEKEVAAMLTEKQSQEKENRWLISEHEKMQAKKTELQEQNERLKQEIEEKVGELEAQEKKEEEFRRIATNLDKRQRSIEEFFYKNCTLQDQILRILGDDNQYQTDQERQDAIESAFQGWEDRLEAQKMASINEAVKDLQEQKEEYEVGIRLLQEAQENYRKAYEILQKLIEDRQSASLMSFLQKTTYKVPKIEWEQVPNKNMTDWEWKPRFAKDECGKQIWETHKPLDDYETFLRGRKRRQAITEEEQAMLDVISRQEADTGSICYPPRIGEDTGKSPVKSI